MSEDTHEEPIEYPDGLSWEDIKDSAAPMFKIWVNGSELEWAKECWGHFAKGGLLNSDTVVEDTTSLLRLVSLALIYQQFSGYAWEENPEKTADEFASNLYIDDVALGYLATRADARFAEGCVEDDDLKNEALNAATRVQRKEIFDCLSKAYGGYIHLYSRMCQTHPSYGEDDEFDLNRPNVDAMSFVSDEFPD